MPFYEYRCESCGHQLEALQKIAEAPLVYCPECGEARLKKLVSKSAFRLKGGGWYATDFKNSGAPPGKDGEAKDGEAKDGGKETGDGKSDGGDGGGKSDAGGEKSGGDGGKNAADKKPASSESLQKTA